MKNICFRNQRQNSHKSRQGAIAVLAMFMLTIFIVIAAFGVELSMFMAEKAEMQRSADAAALAACWEYTAHRNQGTSDADARIAARQHASNVAGTNLVRLRSLDMDKNQDNSSNGDIVFGTFDGFGNTSADMTALPSGLANSVTVRFRQTSNQNGEVRFTLGRLLGIRSKPLQVDAVAAIARKVRGFKIPPGSSATLGLLPFAIKEGHWDSLSNGSARDDYSYDPETGRISAGSDGIPEINIFPHDTGASGNSGMVDIGNSNNSNADVKRQILDGISESDLAHHGGKLEFNSNGELLLNGDTGISAGFKNEMAKIVGDPRIMSVYSSVSGSGNNANFTINQFVGVRMMHFDLTGSKKKGKKIIIQPASVVAPHSIISTNPGEEPSVNIFAPAVIVK